MREKKMIVLRGKNANVCCEDQIKAVPSHRILICTMIHEETYRTPEAYICDIEILANVSHRTAQRIMAKIKAFYGLGKLQKPTIDQVKAYLRPSG